MTNAITSPDKERICARIESLWVGKNALAVYDICRWNDNFVSRAHVKTLAPTAPEARAAQKVWEAWLIEQFPEIPELVRKKLEVEKEKSLARQKAFQADMLKRHAECGPRISINGGEALTPLAFVQKLLSDGYKTEKRGKGLTRFVKDNVCFGPMRNAHVNSAVQYLEMTESAVSHAS